LNPQTWVPEASMLTTRPLKLPAIAILCHNVTKQSGEKGTKEPHSGELIWTESGNKKLLITSGEGICFVKLQGPTSLQHFKIGCGGFWNHYLTCTDISKSINMFKSTICLESMNTKTINMINTVQY
jgi:hypothetical protein